MATDQRGRLTTTIYSGMQQKAAQLMVFLGQTIYKKALCKTGIFSTIFAIVCRGKTALV
jgi:hypothetical protein